MLDLPSPEEHSTDVDIGTIHFYEPTDPYGFLSNFSDHGGMQNANIHVDFKCTSMGCGTQQQNTIINPKNTKEQNTKQLYDLHLHQQLPVCPCPMVPKVISTNWKRI